MKRIKMIITAVAIFAIVGGALAFKTAAAPNLFECNASTGLCFLPATPYSTTAGTPVQTPPQLYQFGGRCTGATPPCKLYTGPVFVNP